MENVMSNKSYDTVIIQEKNTMEVNPTKLTMTEFGLAAVIESTENEAEKIITVSVPILAKNMSMNSKRGWMKMFWLKLDKMISLMLMKTRRNQGILI